MKIRKAIKSDLKEIAGIFRIESSKPPYNKKRTPEKALHVIKEDFMANDTYVAIVDSKIAGFIMGNIDSGIKDKLWIYELWVLKKYQGQRIGRELMGKIESTYKKKGITIFQLVADLAKGGAYGFYKKLGYKADTSMVFMRKKVK